MDGTGTLRRKLTAVIGAMLAVALAAPVSADTIERTDPNDTKGELDLASVRLLHRPDDVHEFRVSTYEAFTNDDVSPPEANFAISIDVNDRNPTDSRWRAEYWVYFWSTRSGFTGVVWNVSTDRTSRVTAGRLSSRSARVLVPIRKIGSPDSYRFAAWSYTEQSPCSAKSACIDAIPNRLPLLLHDYTPPPVTLTAPKVSTDESLSLDFSVTFEVSDDRYGSGIDWWKLQAKESTATTWKTVTTGGSAGTFTRDVTGVQGAVMQTRVLVRDRSGNTTTSAVRQTVVPFDDTDPAVGLTIAYSPEWVAATGNTSRYLATDHAVTAATGVTFTVTFSGTKYCLLFDRDAGDATLTIDASPVAFTGCVSGLAPGPHTAVVTYTGNAFMLDGVAVWP